MAQTRMSEYFSARKNTFTNNMPSKRRKISSADIEIESQRAANSETKVNIPVSKTRTRKRVSKVASSSTFPNKLSSITTASTDDHSERVRKMCSPADEAVKPKCLTPVSSPSKGLSSPLKSVGLVSASHTSVGDNKRSNFNVMESPPRTNNWVNEQAKNILHSRGSALLKASLQNNGNKKADIACEQMALNLADHQFKTSPKKPQDLANPVSNKGRSRLRKKFVHLLEDCKETDSSNDVCATESSEKNVRPIRASDRFGHLTVKKSQPSLQLPEKFKQLIEAFRCVDSILFLLNQRSETCTFEKLQQSVQQMSGRSFDTKHLAMMKTVCPNGFIFRQEKGLHLLSGGKCNGYQLTIEANFKAFSIGTEKLSSTTLITRRLAFENSLLELVKRHHQDFLESLNIDLPDSQIHRWHPKFKLNDVPNIEPSALPKAPLIKTVTNAKDLLLASRGNLIPKVQKALENLEDKGINVNNPKTEHQQKQEKDRSIESKKDKTNNTNLKGVSQSLLERIRLKEKKKTEALLTMDPKKEHRLEMMARLPEIARILKAHFTSERKVAIPSEDCVLKLQQSYGTAISLVQLEDHLKLLAELVPKWLSLATVRKVPYIKLAKNEDINNVLNILLSKKNTEESGS